MAAGKFESGPELPRSAAIAPPGGGTPNVGMGILTICPKVGKNYLHARRPVNTKTRANNRQNLLSNSVMPN